MSDDTPTQRFDVGGDAPTERFAAPTAETPTPETPRPEDRTSRRLIIILSIIGGVLLLALIAVLVVLLTRGSGTPVAPPTASTSVTPTADAATPTSSTPSATPSATPSTEPGPPAPPPPPPPSTDPAVDSFTINPGIVDCSGKTAVVITLQWSTSNANAVYFGVDTPDASVGPFFGDSLPASGNSTNDFPSSYRPFEYTCGNGSHVYTITAVSADGTKKDSTSVTVTG